MATAILFGLCFLSLSHGQTIRPVLSEYTSKVAKGSFELVNPSLVPLTVILEPKSFSLGETGEISYRVLDQGIHLKLSSMSFQIPPEQSYSVFYEARAEELPAWFVIYASIGGFHKSSGGVEIRLDLPHTVYILPKESVTQSDLLITPLGLSSDKAHLNFRVSNTGPWFGRTLSTALNGKGGTTEGMGFPLFPHSTRVIEVPCKPKQEITYLRLRLKNFKLDSPVPNLSEGQACVL